EARAAGETPARAIHVRALADHAARVRRALESAVLAGGVDDREAVALGWRQVEVRVPHLQRLEDARAQELVERDAGHALDQHAQDVRRVAVDEALARLRVERQRGHARDRRGDRLVAVGEVPALDAGLGPAVPRGAVPVADAGGVREQVADRDGAFGGDNVVALAAGAWNRHRRLPELRQVHA